MTAAIRPVFETLAAESLLDKCRHGGTQNTNESFHHLIWERSPKTTFCGRARIELAVADATIVYNEGELRRDILVELGIAAGYYTMQSFKELDAGRVRGAAQGTVAARQQRQKRTLDNARLMDDTVDYYEGGAH